MEYKLVIFLAPIFIWSAAFSQEKSESCKIDSVKINHELTAYCKYDSISIKFNNNNKIIWYYLFGKVAGSKMREKNGHLHISGYTKKASSHLISAEWFKNGKLEYYSIKDLNRKLDTAVCWYESGAVKWKSHAIDSFGDIKETQSYYESGKLREISYSDKMGASISSKEWCENGTLINEVKEGEQLFYNKAYHCNGQTKIEGLYHNRYGLYFGPHKVYYENGNTRREGSYIDVSEMDKAIKEIRNIQVGQWKYYFETGKIEHIENYDGNGKKDGEWIYYNKKGKALKKVYYKNDLQVRKQKIM